MSIERPRTGYELDGPDRFRFTTIKPPPTGALPSQGRTLATELSDHHEQWNAANARHTDLTSAAARRAARRKASRSGDDLPGNVHEQQLDADIEAAAQEMARHEAAGRLIAAELDAAIRADADDQVIECRRKIEDAQIAHQQALTDLEDARQELVANAAYLLYWKEVAAGGSAAWGGRPAGNTAHLRGPDGFIPLEPFAQHVASLRQEVARLARATAVGDEAPAA